MGNRAFSPSDLPHFGATVRQLRGQGIYRAIVAGSERRNGLLCIEENWSQSTMVLTPHSSPILIKKSQFPIKIDDHAQDVMP